VEHPAAFRGEADDLVHHLAAHHHLELLDRPRLVRQGLEGLEGRLVESLCRVEQFEPGRPCPHGRDSLWREAAP